MSCLELRLQAGKIIVNGNKNIHISKQTALKTKTGIILNKRKVK